MTINQRIKELRTEKELSQKTLAKALKIDRTTITKYEIGHTEPKVYILCKYAIFFDVSLDYIVGLVDEFGNKLDLQL